MKRILLTISLFISAITYAQDCSELFISEYLEGLGNNKALEIYNPTDNTIDLSNYFVVRYDNGSSTPTVLNAVQLTGTIAPKDVHVGVIDKRDPNGVDQEAPIWEDLEAKADAFYCPDYNQSKAFYWNGNDAVVLFKGIIPPGTPLAMPITSLTNIQPIDIFGKIGENPGEPAQGGGWTYDGTPVASGGVVVSANHFLVRKPSVKKGVTLNPSTFKPNEEWDSLSYFVYVIDEFGDTVTNSQGNPARRINVDNLGLHTCDCGGPTSVSTETITDFSFEIYPNPVTSQQINLLSTNKVKEIIITDALGKLVKYIPNAKSVMTIDLNVNSGLYFISAKGGENQQYTKRFIVK
ncbi:MAG: T9SS type A sorting domain-containing protein [Brumimicrobium sp.]|nr:T9SS type A sorting domain-containing protein [Brumimicrobium sp.]